MTSEERLAWEAWKTRPCKDGHPVRYGIMHDGSRVVWCTLCDQFGTPPGARRTSSGALLERAQNGGEEGDL